MTRSSEKLLLKIQTCGRKKPVEIMVTNNYAETTSTEVKLSLKAHQFFGKLRLKDGSGNFFCLLLYLGPEIKNLEETPYSGRERIFVLSFLGQKQGFSHLFFT